MMSVVLIARSKGQPTTEEGSAIMTWVRRLFRDTDLAFGLMLSICLGSLVGLVVDHPLGQVIYSPAIGAIVLLMYLLSYYIGAIWLVGLQQGLVIVTVFVWCIILSSAL
jgi:hypothetical protein